MLLSDNFTINTGVKMGQSGSTGKSPKTEKLGKNMAIAVTNILCASQSVSAEIADFGWAIHGVRERLTDKGRRYVGAESDR